MSSRNFLFQHNIYLSLYHIVQLGRCILSHERNGLQWYWLPPRAAGTDAALALLVSHQGRSAIYLRRFAPFYHSDQPRQRQQRNTSHRQRRALRAYVTDASITL